MENFIVSARKYRPDTFDSVVGQGAITNTLKNAIKNNHLAQAYLFCGPRGVGKTTCARIFAKTINCQNLSESIEPCNKCESCASFNESRSYNIHELDAASNNSVDDIRNLIDQVRIPPQVGTKSVYIIDEVHMLSQAAFNAFLKTLEEPPSHAYFILATTEKHKIIPTILSRCQIFDFNRIQLADMANHLEDIAQKESIEYEMDALAIIAQKADGGLRDALSIFDQIVSFAGNNITYKAVIENLNVLDYEYYFKLTNEFLINNISATLLIYNDILNNGFDSRNFILGLSSHFRDLLVCKDQSTLQLLEVGDSIKKRYLEQTATAKVDFLIEGLEILNKCDIGYNTSRNKRLHVEMALIRLCDITNEKKKSKPVATKALQTTPSTSSKNTIAPPETPKQKIRVGKPKEMDGFSIKQELQYKPESQEAPQKKNNDPVVGDTSPPDTASKEDVVKAWLNYAESIKVEKPRIANIIKTCTPELHNNNELHIAVSTDLQKDSLLEERSMMMRFFKQEQLPVDYIYKVAIKDNQQEPSNKLYTDEDKFQHMAQKNPLLNKLRSDLGLDFE